MISRTHSVVSVRWRRRSLAVSVAFVCAACSLNAQGLASLAVPRTGENSEAVYHAKVREAVTMVLQTWTEAVQRKDSAAVAAAYTKNVRSFIGDRPEAVSASAVVRQLFATPIAGTHLAFTVDDFDMSGEMAFVTGVLVVQSDKPDFPPAFVRSLFVLRFDDWRNRWQVREQILNWHGAIQEPQPVQ